MPAWQDNFSQTRMWFSVLTELRHGLGFSCATATLPSHTVCMVLGVGLSDHSQRNLLSLLVLWKVELLQRSKLADECLVLALQDCHPVLQAADVLFLLPATLTRSFSTQEKNRERVSVCVCVRERDKQTDRDKEKETESEERGRERRDRKRERQRQRETDRQRQTDRQTDREENREKWEK